METIQNYQKILKSYKNKHTYYGTNGLTKRYKWTDQV